MSSVDEQWMRQALDEARQAGADGDVPVGAVLVRGSTVLARGRNRREVAQDPTLHAEIDAIRRGSAAQQAWRLIDTTLYVTLEPCAMCAGALVLGRVGRVVYACSDPKAGAVDTFFGIGKGPPLNHTFAVTSRVLEVECRAVLQSFFRARRPLKSSS